MPHFVLECSENVLAAASAKEVLTVVYQVARESMLFNESDIKVRIRPFADFVNGPANSDFVHVFGYIMEGRTIDQRNKLSRAIVTALKELLPDVPVISMNVINFEKATYNNRDSI